MPAELVHTLGGLSPDAAHGQGRQRARRTVGMGGIARQAGHGHRLFDIFVERGEVFVSEGPIFGHATQCADPEIRGHESYPMRAIDQCRPTDACKHQRIDVRLLGIDRIILRSPAYIGVRVPFAQLSQFPFGPRTVKLISRNPTALLQHCDRHARAYKFQRGDSTSWPCTYDHHITACVRDKLASQR